VVLSGYGPLGIWLLGSISVAPGQPVGSPLLPTVDIDGAAELIEGISSEPPEKVGAPQMRS
jgi:hypothetical protein